MVGPRCARPCNVPVRARWECEDGGLQVGAAVGGKVRDARNASLPGKGASRLFQAGEVFDEVAHFRAAEGEAEFFGHAGHGAVAGFDLGFFDFYQAVFGGVEDDFGVGLALDDAGEVAAVVQDDGGVFVAFGDLPVGEEDGFEEVLARGAGADAGEVGAGFAALAVDLVAALAGDVDALVVGAFAGRGVAAVEGFAPRREVIVLGQGGAVFFQLGFDHGIALAAVGDVEEFEVQLFLELAGDESVEEVGDDAVGFAAGGAAVQAVERVINEKSRGGLGLALGGG